MSFAASITSNEQKLTLFCVSAVICMWETPWSSHKLVFLSLLCSPLLPVSSFSHFGDGNYFSLTSTCYPPNCCYFPSLRLLASTPPSVLLKSLQTSASWLCVSLISFCQAFVFDHRSSVSTLLLLLSTSFPPQSLLIACNYWCVCMCVSTCECAFLMYYIMHNVFFAYLCIQYRWVRFCVCVYVSVRVPLHKNSFFPIIKRFLLCAQT